MIIMIGDRQQLVDAAHIAHVLLVMQAVNDRACAEEQQRLEEGVREQVEHRRRIGPRPAAKNM
jgi:hypothetical protein